MARKVAVARRREVERQAAEIRLDSVRRGLAVEETVNRIMGALPEVFALEAWRFANGWTRVEVSAQLDELYEADGLAPPRLDPAVLCRWEHGDRRPDEERIDFFCRLYRTRRVRLGFDTGQRLGDTENPHRAGIVDAFPFTSQDSERDLLGRIEAARTRVNMFGLTRNFYGRDDVLPVFERKAAAGVLIQLFVMDPYCASRADRYRVEPAEAAMEDPDRYVREVLRPMAAVAARQPDFRVFTFNFPCSYAIEEVDGVCRVMLYGHGKRGTEGPIITFADGTPTHTYLVDQIRWLERLAAADTTPEPWASKKIDVRRLEL